MQRKQKQSFVGSFQESRVEQKQEHFVSDLLYSQSYQHWKSQLSIICSFRFLGRSSKTFLNSVPILFAVVAKFIRTVRSNMDKFFATEALDSTHVPASWLALCCKSHWNWGRVRATFFHGGLSEEALFLTKQIIEASI